MPKSYHIGAECRNDGTVELGSLTQFWPVTAETIRVMTGPGGNAGAVLLTVGGVPVAAGAPISMTGGIDG
jgi:hypothetical protein